MKNLRIITPTLVTVVIAILGFIVMELRGARSYADKLVMHHESRPHIMTEERLDELEKGITRLTIEIQLLRKEINCLNKWEVQDGRR